MRNGKNILRMQADEEDVYHLMDLKELYFVLIGLGSFIEGIAVYFLLFKIRCWDLIYLCVVLFLGIFLLLRQSNKISKRIMEAEELTVGRVHHGHNIRRFRIEKNMNQEVLSQLVHLSQSAVSKYEQMRVIDDEMLHRFSRALGVPFEYLKSLEEDAQTVVFENNTVNNNDQASANIGGYVEENNRVNNYNPIEKITELYERLLKEKDEKYAALERRLQNIEQSLQK